MKKVLLVSPAPPPIGGITSWTVEYMLQMPSLGCTPILINTTVTGKRLENNKKVNFFDEFIRLRTIKKNIKQALHDQEIKVLHYNASCFTFGLVRDYIVLRPFFKRVSVVYHCHCNLESNINNSIAEFFFSKITKRVNCVLAINRRSLIFAENFTTNVLFVPNFINKLYVEYVRVREKLKDIVFVGRVCHSKGINELVEAAKSVSDINIHIIGPDDDHLLDSVSVSNIIRHGAQPHDKVIELMKSMDAVILPSYTEGFPLVILEAMACGLPVIATGVGAIPDMIEKNGGLLIPIQNSGAIVDAIQSIRKCETRQAMGEFNLNKVKNEFLSNVVLKKFFNIYESLTQYRNDK